MSEHLDRLDRERVMSESTARAERRDLRRAMGPHVQAFASDTKQAIQTLQASLTTLHQQIATMRVILQGQIDGKQSQIAKLDDDIDNLRRDIHALQYRSRWERLRTFILGR